MAVPLEGSTACGASAAFAALVLMDLGVKAGWEEKPATTSITSESAQGTLGGLTGRW